MTRPIGGRAMTRPIGGWGSANSETDLATGVVGLGLGSGYVVWVGAGVAGVLGMDTQRPSDRPGRLLRICARLASGSASVTIQLSVNAVNVASATDTVGKEWAMLEFDTSASFVAGDLLAIRYEGLAITDSMSLRAVWSP